MPHKPNKDSMHGHSFKMAVQDAVLHLQEGGSPVVQLPQVHAQAPVHRVVGSS